MDSGGQRVAERDGSSAWRRRQRRLRSWWRHEQQSIVMALAAAQHSAQNRARLVSHNALRSHNTTREDTEFFAMSEDSDVVGGARPPPLVEVRPQARVLQRTVEPRWLMATSSSSSR